MATSIYKGFVRFDAASQIADASPVWAGLSRDHLVNNANHIADEQAQALINYSMSTTSAYLTPISGFSADTYYRVARFGPVSLLCKADGSSYPIRVRMGFYASNAATIVGRLVCCASSDSLRVRDSSAATNAATFTSTATADAWDDADTDNLISLSIDDMILCTRPMNALAAVAGATYSVPVFMPIVDVYLKSTSAASVPRLTRLYAAEYVGT